MIISHIIGGLGNQMFQYAVGRSLSLLLGAEYKLDTQDFASYGLHHGFELQRVFGIGTQIANDDDVTNVLGWRGCSMLRRLLVRRQLAWARNGSFIVEPTFDYWPGIWMVPSNCYLNGYWQSEKYFWATRNEIREDFTFSGSLTGENASLADEIARVESVSVHVRRGDYVTNPKTMGTHGVCSLAYYKRAMEHIAQHVHNPHFYVFSDDVEWARAHVTSSFKVCFVENNKGNESYRDMQLMTLCKHNIIANSSFSWWGAWLNSREHKLVVAPRAWFTSVKDTPDLIPESWYLF